MPSNPVVVIGGSAGALEPLLRIVAQLPPTFSAPIVIVIHSDPDSPSSLPEILSRAGPLPAHHAHSGEPMLGGHLYVAPPDQHLLVDGEVLVLSHEPKEHRSRPSIDVTMRSAAATRGASVIGVLLSGLLDDGTSGLSSIQEQGGRILVQDPEEALFPSMPHSALQRVHADGILPSTEIAGRLEQLVHDSTSIQEVTPLEQGERRPTPEVRVAAEQHPHETGMLKTAQSFSFTCPDCRDVMVKLQESEVLSFRCHTGHTHSAATLLAALRQSVDINLWNTVRALDENVMLLDHLGTLSAQQGEGSLAAAYQDETRARRALTRHLRHELETLIGGVGHDHPAS